MTPTVSDDLPLQKYGYYMIRRDGSPSVDVLSTNNPQTFSSPKTFASEDLALEHLRELHPDLALGGERHWRRWVTEPLDA